MFNQLKKIDRGILYMMMATVTFAFMGGFAKALAQELPAMEVTFFRNIFGVVLIGISLWKAPMVQEGGKPWLLFFRGAIGFLSLVAYFYNMGHVPLGEAVTYNKTSPLFLGFFAWIFLKEKLPKGAIFALIIGFIGILLIAQPEQGVFDKYDLLGIFSGIGAALAYTSIRELKNYYDTRAIALSFMCVGTVGPLIFMGISEWTGTSQDYDFLLAKFVMPQGISWFHILGLGVLATASQLLMTKAYSLTRGGLVGTITYSQIIFAVLIGTMMGDAWPNLLCWTGIILVITAGVIATLSASKS